MFQLCIPLSGWPVLPILPLFQSDKMRHHGDLEKGVAAGKVPHHALSHSQGKIAILSGLLPFVRNTNCGSKIVGTWVNSNAFFCLHQVVYTRMSGESSCTLLTAETMDPSGFYLSAANTFMRLAQR